MLDLRSKIVLKYLVKECNEGSYKVIDTDDIVLCLPKKVKPDREVVFQIIKHLENGEYLSVKYSDDEQYCLCPLPFGRQFIENDEIQTKNRKILKKLGMKNNIITFLCAFLGAFLAILFYNLIL